MSGWAARGGGRGGGRDDSSASSGRGRGGYQEKGAASGGSGGMGRAGLRRRHPIVTWADDQASFKVEQENEGISDDSVRSWIAALRKELGGWSKKVYCSSLNLSHNDLSDYGVQEIMNFLIQERIPVQMIKLFKNWISDDGVRAIGELIKKSPDPVVQEIHLSHNCITSRGALAIFEVMRDSGRYPCSRGKEGSPLWLRMENNQIQWESILSKINEWKDFRWTSGDTRDAWRREGANTTCPMLAMHRSYHHQMPVETYSSAASRSDRRRERGDDYWYEEEKEDAWSDEHSDSVAARPSAIDGGQRRQRWAPDWESSPHEEQQFEEDEEEEEQNHVASSSEIQDVRRFVDEKLTEAAEVQMKKFNLIFSILGELQERQAKLESSMQEMVQQQQQHPQQQQQSMVQQQPVQAQGYTVMMNPVDGGGQQNWSGDQHQFGSGVW